MQSMLGGLENVLIGGDPILSSTINLRTVESEIAKSLSKVQDNNKDVDIGSYPFFKAGKLGVSIVLRCTDQNKINQCNDQIINFVKEKKIEIVEKDWCFTLHTEVTLTIFKWKEDAKIVFF